MVAKITLTAILICGTIVLPFVVRKENRYKI
jgi:hypothetical protein